MPYARLFHNECIIHRSSPLYDLITGSKVHMLERIKGLCSHPSRIFHNIAVYFVWVCKKFHYAMFIYSQIFTDTVRKQNNSVIKDLIKFYNYDWVISRDIFLCNDQCLALVCLTFTTLICHVLIAWLPNNNPIWFQDLKGRSVDITKGVFYSPRPFNNIYGLKSL